MIVIENRTNFDCKKIRSNQTEETTLNFASDIFLTITAFRSETFHMSYNNNLNFMLAG